MERDNSSKNETSVVFFLMWNTKTDFRVSLHDDVLKNGKDFPLRLWKVLCTGDNIVRMIGSHASVKMTKKAVSGMPGQ